MHLLSPPTLGSARGAASCLPAAAALLAHEGARLEPHDLWRTWGLEPGVLIPLALSAAIYAVGLGRA